MVPVVRGGKVRMWSADRCADSACGMRGGESGVGTEGCGGRGAEDGIWSVGQLGMQGRVFQVRPVDLLQRLAQAPQVDGPVALVDLVGPQLDVALDAGSYFLFLDSASAGAGLFTLFAQLMP